MEAEWKTRKTRIDPRLDRAGWESGAPRSGPHRREEHPTDHGPADYTLCAGDRVLGVVEAKKVTIGPQNVLTQAERYAAGLSSNPFHFDGLHVPFLYATNGELIWFHDVRHPMNRSRKVAGFHTPAALQDDLRAFDASLLEPDRGGAVRFTRADSSNFSALSTAVDHLTREFRADLRRPIDIHISVLRHLLACLVLNLAHAARPTSSPAFQPSEAYLRFRDAVERDFRHSRCLDDYARALGYSSRTLSRATLADAGVNAKEFIDRRVVLEAKRLLAHSQWPAARIATELGFSSATNFSKYFHKHTGAAPIAFRSTTRSRT